MKIYFEPQAGRLLESEPRMESCCYYEVPFEARATIAAAVKKATAMPVSITYPDGFIRNIAELEAAFRGGGDWKVVLENLKDSLDERIYYVGKPKDGSRRATVRGERAARALSDHFNTSFELKRDKRIEFADCTCVQYCSQGPGRCSLNGQFHVHPDGGDGYGLCPIHPNAPGDR